MGEESEGTNLLRDPHHFQLNEVRDFLKTNCMGMPLEAKNAMCYRVKAGELWDDYLNHCEAYSFCFLNKQEFALAVEWVFPLARLSEWRVVDGVRTKEFDGIIRCYKSATLFR